MRKFKPLSSISAINFGYLLKKNRIFARPNPGQWLEIKGKKGEEIAAQLKKTNLFVEIG